MSENTKKITEGGEYIEHLRDRMTRNPFFHMTGSEVELGFLKNMGLKYDIRSGYGGEYITITNGDDEIDLPLFREKKSND